MEQYFPAFEGEAVPKELQGKRDMVFSVMPDIFGYHKQ
jgi:hypothetical protein